jgi:protein phosphatase
MKFCGKTDVGMHRQVNQDSYRALRIWNDEATLLLVCDGMGGHKAGEIASSTAVDIFCEKIASSPCKETEPDKILEFIRYTLVCAASEANAAIFRLADENDEYHGMGTTLVATIIYGGYFYAINIGDSRFYIVTKEETRLVTKDHSFVQYLIDNGKLSEEEAKECPQKNVITRAVGISDKLDVDFFSAPLAPWGSGYLVLCSDGLSNYVDHKTMEEILCSHSHWFVSQEDDLSKKADALIAFANEKGGSDNITAVIARF